MNINDQNRQIGQLLMELNHDLRMREKPEIQISALRMFCYFIVGAAGFLLFTGVLRACVHAHG